MNKLKALLIAGLLSLTSVSFASGVTYTADYLAGDETVASGAQAGTVDVTNFGLETFGGTMGGSLDVAETVWYQLNINVAGLISGISANIGNTAIADPQLSYSFFNLDGSSFAGGIYENLTGLFEVALSNASSYKLVLTGEGQRRYDGDISAVPVPAAGILFASALLGAGAFGRRKKKAKASVVGAFARAS